MRIGTLGVMVVMLAIAPACGGGDGPRRGTPVVLEIESVGLLDGFVRNDGMVFTNGGGPGVGDLDAATSGLAFRMFYAFRLDEIPEGVTVTSVRLRVFQLSIVGTPYENLGDLLVDHVEPGADLDPGDYAGNTLDSNIGTLAMGFGRNYANLGVSAQVAADRSAGRTHSWFRLRFPVDSNTDGGNDVLVLGDGEGSRGPDNPPILEVTYVVP